MISRPSLALLVPAYNAAAFLPRLLASARQQSEPFDEIWVYDDCSTDDTAAVAERLGASIVRGSHNVGCTAGKRQLLQHVKSDWAHFHDADDELLPDFARTVRTLIERDDADVIIVGSEERSEADPDYRIASVPDAEQFRQHPFAYSMRYKVNAISGAYHVAFLKNCDALRIDPARQYNEDQAIQLNLVIAGARFAATPDILVRSYVQGDSMSRSNGLACLKAHFSVMQQALEQAPEQVDRTLIEQAVAARLWHVAAGAPAYGDFATADAAARLARRLAPIPADAGGRWFRALAGISPALALRIREHAIRLLKPQLRR